MLQEDQKIYPQVLSNPKMTYARDGYGHGLVEVAEKYPNVVALCADLAESTRTHWFKEKFPERYIELGVAEQNLATIASGMAAEGKIPFIASYATFSPGRNNEQIRTTISLNEQPVKIMGCHAGISVGPDGATHQALEDIALMRVQPNMNVIVPCDEEETRKAIHTIVDVEEPFYVRFGRAKSAVITTPESPFKIGQANVLWDSGSPQVTIIACGIMVYEALVAAQRLQEEGAEVTVINNHSIKPLDVETIVRETKRSKAVVTAEEHQVAGGMGSAVAEILARECPVPIEFVGVQDRFGQSGEPVELMQEYGLTSGDIIKAVKKVLQRK